MTVRFSASYADRLMACPGSANLELAIPGWQEPDRDPNAGAKGIGTDIHALLADVTQWSNNTIAEYRDLVAAYAKLHYTKRHKITADNATTQQWMIDMLARDLPQLEECVETFRALEPYAPKMLRFISEAAGEMYRLFTDPHLTEWASERSYTVQWLQTKPFTTPDLWVYYGKRRHLVMIDFKSGAIPVPAEGNKQLLYYAVTAVEQEPIDPETITLQVIQPGNNSEHLIQRWELDNWRDEARAAEQRIINKDLTLRPSDKGCTFCPANPHTRGDKGAPLCPAMMDVLYPPVIDDEIYELI